MTSNDAKHIAEEAFRRLHFTRLLQCETLVAISFGRGRTDRVRYYATLGIQAATNYLNQTEVVRSRNH